MYKKEYRIEISIYRSPSDKNSKAEKGDFLWVTESGLETLFNMTDILKDEMDLLPAKGKVFNSRFEEVLRALINRFNEDDLDDNEGLKRGLLRIIEGFKKDKSKVKALEIKIDTLREELILFWEKIYEDYCNVQQKYDEEFERHKDAMVDKHPKGYIKKYVK